MLPILLLPAPEAGAGPAGSAPPIPGDDASTAPDGTSGQDSLPSNPPDGMALAQPGGFGWPLQPRPPILRWFDKPAQNWLPGHRGVDLGGKAGQPVLAAGAGFVAFAGVVGGKPVVSVEHTGGLRTTYEPVRASVTMGRRVIRGDTLGVLKPGHPGCATPCLHWGLRQGREYLDPLGLVHAAPLRLKPVHPDT